MSHEVAQGTLRFFEDWEGELIDAWLTENGLEACRPAVCGSCCGIYADEYGVSLDLEQVYEFNVLAADKKMDAHADTSGVYIGAAREAPSPPPQVSVGELVALAKAWGWRETASDIRAIVAHIRR